jgi:HlyD family secretion protein
MQKKFIMGLVFCLTVCSNLTGCSNKDSNQALGTLERDRIVLKATAAEIIVALPIREGATVKKGDLLVQLDDTQQQAQIAKVKASVASAKALQSKLRNGARAEDIAAARAQLEGAEAQLLQTEKMFSRTAILVGKKLSGQAELDKARAQRDSTIADVRRAKQNLLLLTNGTRAEDLAQADALVAEAEAVLTFEQYKLQQLSITAARDGMLDRLPKYLGERTSIGEAVALLLAGDAPYARVYIPEPVRTQLKLGQALNVHVDGYVKVFAGKLRWISQDPAFTPYYALNSKDRARLVYLAEIDLPATANDLPGGIPAQVDLTSTNSNTIEQMK